MMNNAAPAAADRPRADRVLCASAFEFPCGEERWPGELARHRPGSEVVRRVVAAPVPPGSDSTDASFTPRHRRAPRAADRLRDTDRAWPRSAGAGPLRRSLLGGPGDGRTRPGDGAGRIAPAGAAGGPPWSVRPAAR